MLHYYGELNTPGETGPAVDADVHLSECADCRALYQTLQRVLNTVDAAPLPERPADYEAQLWNRVAPSLPKTRRAGWRGWFATHQKWIAATAMAGMLVAAFLAGRVSKPTAPAGGTVASNDKVRERLLLVAVGDHLERSQMVLVEVTNVGATKGKFDISYEQMAAEDLVEANRIYRQTALSTGDTGTAALLDDLERTLLEIAHSPAQMNSNQLTDLRQQIEDRGLLFKVKVFQSKVNARESAPVVGAQGTL